MLPVSGAEQLNGSAPIGDRPMISQSGAYSRLVKASRIVFLRQKQIPEHRPLSPWPSVPQSPEFGPAIACFCQLPFEHGFRRIDMLLHERVDAFGKGGGARRGLRQHGSGRLSASEPKPWPCRRARSASGAGSWRASPVCLGEFGQPVADIGQPDLIGIEHRSAAPDRKAVAIDPDHVDVARRAARCLPRECARLR